MHGIAHVDGFQLRTVVKGIVFYFHAYPLISLLAASRRIVGKADGPHRRRVGKGPVLDAARIIGVGGADVIIDGDIRGRREIVDVYHFHLPHGCIIIANIGSVCGVIGQAAHPVGVVGGAAIIAADIFAAVNSAAFGNPNLASVLHKAVADIGLRVFQIAHYATHIITPSLDY